MNIPSPASRLPGPPLARPVRRRPRSVWLRPALMSAFLFGIWVVRAIQWFSQPDDPGRVSAASLGGFPTRPPVTVDVASDDGADQKEHESPEPPKDVSPSDASPSEVPAPGALDDESLRRKLPGRWTREYSGTWNLAIHEDGTGVMVVHPNRFWALVVGPKITIRMIWKVEDGKTVFDSLSGEPASSFEAAMKFWKRHQERKVITLDGERFVYLSDDGRSHSVWTRADR